MTSVGCGSGHESGVSIIMPVRHEGSQLPEVLAAVQAQECLEILVAVGPSRDDTERIVRAAAVQDPRLRVLPNPEGIVSTGLNRAIRVARGRQVVRIDGHCLVPAGFVARLSTTAARTGASCVGPRLQTVGAGPVQEGIAAAMSSALGVGAARFRTSATSGYVDTVAFGLYETAVLLLLGGFREDLVRNQDDELNARLRRAGGTVYLDADVCVDYYPRATFRSLSRQYYEYGYWRTVTARLHRDRLRPRQLAPGAFVAGLVATGLLAATGRPAALGLLAAAYAAVLFLLVLQTQRRTGRPIVALLSAPAALVLHLSYGWGLWRSLLRPSILVPARRPSESRA
jgi:glycosyltransferase involved in cell wall biosynthesis